MSERINQLIQLLFNKPSLTECTPKELQEVTHQYPSFSAGHLLLLKKLEVGTPEYANQYQKAALYAYSPLQLNQWLADKEIVNDFPAIAEERIEEPVAEVQPDIIEEPEMLPAIESIPEEKVEPTVPAAKNQVDEAATIEHPEVIPPAVQRQEVEKAGQFPSDEMLPEKEQTIGHSEILNSDKEFSEAELAAEDAATDGLPAEEELPLAPLKTINPLDEKPAEISFEPYHTVDYFASQGIKLGKVEATNDQLGKQLKSFTEWLKTMKRIPANEINPNGDGLGERKVVNLAAHSLNKTDVLTESMAEVWLKQGNKDKAAEVYNKLSLLNPSKRAYFAAKLESLKKPN